MKARIKNIVKVMEIHSLLRVDSSKKKAEKYFGYEDEITHFMNVILNNRNFILDKKILSFERKEKVLNIYIGNDLGFCGNFNSSINSLIKQDEQADKIIIGKKLKNQSNNVLTYLTKEEYFDNIGRVENILYDAIINQKYKEINVIYNHYYNISKIELITKELLPLKKMEKLDPKEYKDDFVVEGDITDILVNLIVLYIMCELKVAIENSYASENIMRQAITRESLKKIDEIDTEAAKVERIEKKNKDFKVTLENSTKIKLLDKNN